jgi:ferritin-like metal-binding protein YciE
MPSVTSPEQLFVHELKDIYYAEKALTKTLPQLAREASDRELEGAFRSHLKETEKHVANLERVFEHLGKRPEAHPCPGIEGIKKEHDEFVSNESPSAEVLNAFLTGAGARTEHYEIAAYEGLITMAEAMGEDEVARLLNENLAQEQNALRKIQTIGKRLAQQGAATAAA